MSRVVVIGAGVIGLCAADALLDDGHEVVILEKDAELAESASFGNGGLVVPSHFVPLAAPGMVALGLRMLREAGGPFGVESLANLELLGWLARFALSGTRRHVAASAPLLLAMNLASRELFRLYSETLECDFAFEQKGLIMLSQTQASHDHEVRLAERAERLGLRTAPLSREDLAELEPGLEMNVAGGVRYHGDAHLSPPRFLNALRERILARGGAIRTQAPVLWLEKEGSEIRGARVRGEVVTADAFVLAAGVWSADLAEGVGLNLSLAAGRGYGFTVVDPPHPIRIPSILVEARVAVTPLPEGIRFVGTMELGGVQILSEGPRLEGMRRRIGLYYPAFEGPVRTPEAWCGLRPCTPDGLPYLGRTAAAKNLVVATGHAMMGMSLGPISGRLVADLIANRAPSIDIRRLSPDRHA